jgi:acyl carrier protein
MHTQEEIKVIVNEIACAVLLEQCAPDVDLPFTGRSSADLFDIVEIVVALEEHFGIEIPGEDFVHITGSKSTIEYISNRLEETREWIQNQE